MCCHVPGKSINLQSLFTAPFFSAYFRTSPGFIAGCLPLVRCCSGSDRVFARLSGADADDLVDRADEDLAVADEAGLGGLDDGVDDLPDVVLRHDDLELDLGDEVHHVG